MPTLQEVIKARYSIKELTKLFQAPAPVMEAPTEEAPKKKKASKKVSKKVK